MGNQNSQSLIEQQVKLLVNKYHRSLLTSSEVEHELAMKKNGLRNARVTFRENPQNWMKRLKLGEKHFGKRITYHVEIVARTILFGDEPLSNEEIKIGSQFEKTDVSSLLFRQSSAR